ncbi:MAG: hypothetical protein HY541_05560 [Deltaproteobacteria bacterium]|nr:hypothetical protein [Deltaproteobacteria bacterium]
MLSFPSFLEDLLLRYIKQTYLPIKGASGKPFNDKDFVFFSKGAKALSEAYTSQRGSLPTNYLNIPVYRSGYLLYFLPVNFLKIVHIMNELDPAEIVGGKVRILDVGAGQGTSMLGLMAFYAGLLAEKKVKDAWLDFTLVDQSYAALKDALNLHQAYAEELQKKNGGFRSACSVKNYDLRRGGLKRFLRNFKYHLIVVANVLNEIPDREARVQFIESLLEDHLEPATGRLILIEPAAQQTSRDLQWIRDRIVTDRKIGHVYAPCLHQETCPLNVVNKRDWCHFYFSWERPKFVEKVDRLIGNKKNWLACSYLVLGKKPPGLTPHPGPLPQGERGQMRWRVISNRMPSNGKEEVVLCGPKGRYHVELLDRDTMPSNRAFHRIGRGDLVDIDVRSEGAKYRVDGKYRVQKNDPVRIVKEN